MDSHRTSSHALAPAPIGSRLAARTLFSAHGIEVVETEWRRDRHPSRADGATSYVAIEFMRVGAYEKRGASGRVFADPGTAVFFQSGEAFEVRHPVGDRNLGTTIRIGADAWDAFDARRPGPPRSSMPPIATTGPALDLELHRLIHRLDDLAASDSVEAEERVFAFAAAVLARGREVETPRPVFVLERARATEMRAFLVARFQERLRLADVAAAVGCSPWHAAKTFARATGSTLHATLRRLRLRAALERLGRGERDLTRLALDVGFSSHSHFSAAFRREFGITPRCFRKPFRPRATPRLSVR